MNLNLPIDIAEQMVGLEKMFRPLFAKQYAGLAPGTKYLHDPEFVRWFESERDGIPGQVDPMTGQMAWKKPPRPNFEQMLALAEEGPEILRRYARATGRELQMEYVITYFQTLAKQARKAEQDGQAV